jgi:hypothetical protein
MRAQGLSVEVPITSCVEMIWTTGLGATGLTIPEHPGRSLTKFGGFALQQNTEWTSYSSLYDEFRVVGIICEFQPSSVAIPSASVQFAVTCDYDSEITAGSLTSMLSVARYTTGRLLSSTAEHQLLYRPTRSRSFLPWQSCANTTARGSVGYFLFSNSVTSIYLGNLVIKHIVHFRGSLG